MKLANTKSLLSNEKTLKIFIFLLITIQPLLDVMSFFLVKLNMTVISTMLRMGMFVFVMLFAFIISDHKRVYYVFAAVAGGYFALHAVNCFRIGYVSFVEDAANFFRTVQTPAMCIAFITVIKRISNPIKIISSAFFANVCTIWGVIGLSYLVGMPEYTYGAYHKVGLMGWFEVHNAQSSIVMLLMPLALLFAYRLSKLFFVAACGICFSLLFFTGTKLTFYSLIIIALGFLFLIAVNFITAKESRKKYIFSNLIPVVSLCAVLVLSFVFIEDSPMKQRENSQSTAYSNHQLNLNDSLAMLDPEDPDNSKGEDELTPEEKAEAKRKKLERYEKLYREFAGGYLNDIINRFGIERVAEKYNYSTVSAELLDAREKKNIFAELAWEESDFLTRCFGYEYSTLVTAEEIYDLENDFPSVFYYSGYVGFGVYILFMAYFAFLVLKEIFKNFKNFVTLESGLLFGTFVLLMGAAQLSGNVLRRPNVSIYISMILACLFVLYRHKKEINNELSQG